MPHDNRTIDVAAMKAFAHPLRMRLYRLLQERGKATSAQLARDLDESTGQTSYHLRQLARHGFVEEDTGVGTARERWWQPVGFSFSDRQWAGDEPVVDTSTDVALASLLMQRTQIEQYAAAAHAWLDRGHAEEPAWRWASLRSQTIAELTPEELEALNGALGAVVEEHVAAARARREDRERDGERRVQVLIHSFPLARPSD